MTIGDRIEEAREEGIRLERRRGQAENIMRMIQMGFDDGTIQEALGLRNTNQIRTIRRKLVEDEKKSVLIQ